MMIEVGENDRGYSTAGRGKLLGKQNKENKKRIILSFYFFIER